MKKPHLFILITILHISSLVAYSQDHPQHTRQSDPAVSVEERAVTNITPRRVPVSVVSIRNIQNEHWLRDVEIEIRNDSSKPISFLNMTLHFPDIPKTRELDGLERGYVIPLWYGRIQLKTGQRPTDEDIPIKPGETYIFTVSEPIWKGFESYQSRKNLSDSLTKRVRLFIDLVRFDDGTRFIGGGPMSNN